MKRAFAAGCLALQIVIASSAAAQSPTGIWEGEIADPRRPQVISIDFEHGVASISGGAAAPRGKRIWTRSHSAFFVTTTASLLRRTRPPSVV